MLDAAGAGRSLLEDRLRVTRNCVGRRASLRPASSHNSFFTSSVVLGANLRA